jgi:hypothetical protein
MGNTEKQDRPSLGLELDLPRELPREKPPQEQRGVLVLEISPLAPNEIKL